MECSICYDRITRKTGRVQLACSHMYHYRCLTHWFLNQEIQTCPLCRKESNDYEKIIHTYTRIQTVVEHEYMYRSILFHVVLWVIYAIAIAFYYITARPGSAL